MSGPRARIRLLPLRQAEPRGEGAQKREAAGWTALGAVAAQQVVVDGVSAQCLRGDRWLVHLGSSLRGPSSEGFDLLTTPYVFSEDDAQRHGRRRRRHRRLPSRPDHRRLDRRGDGADAAGLRFRRSRPGRAAAAKVRNDVIVLCHGGRSPRPRTRLHPGALPGRATASTAPRAWSGCPTEIALTEPTRRFTADRTNAP